LNNSIDFFKTLREVLVTAICGSTQNAEIVSDPGV